MNIWEEIKSKLDIVDVISEYIPVSPSGTNYRASSPFKKEKTPSLMISQQKQIWHDFSSGRGGDIFGFIMQIENCTRSEALKKLATKAGVQLNIREQQDTRTEEEKTIQSSGFQALEWTAELYHTVLKKILRDREHPVTQYCITRKLTPELIDLFKIGYAPDNNFLLKLLQKNNRDTALFEKIELLVTRSRGLKDKFVDRIMIPIRSTEGKVVGFTGRVLPHDTSKDRPKYLNSSQSEWFDKSRIWFGLDTARRSVLLEKKVIVVEGNMDVIAAFGSGLTYTVASQGTSFTQNQLKILSRFTKNILLAFDNDTAGIAAAEKFYLTATPMGFNVSQIQIPEQYKDLDEYLTTLGTNPTLPVEYFMDSWIARNSSRLTTSDSGEQKKAVQDACSLLAVVDDITFEQYTKKIHAITGISSSTLAKLVKNARDSAPKNQALSDLYSNKIAEAGIVQSSLSTLKEDLLITWQKILTEYGKDALVNDQLLEALFNILKEFEVFTELNLEDYKSIHKGEIEFIREQLVASGDIVSAHMLLKNIEKMIDSRMSSLVTDNDNLERYYKLKQLLQNI